MQKEQKVQKQQIKKIQKKKTLLHYFLVYFMCLVAAFITWLLVRYSMRAEMQTDDSLAWAETVDLLADTAGEDLYV